MRRDVSALCAKSFPAHRAGGRAWRLLHVCGLVILPIFAAQQATGDTSCEVPRILDVDGIVVPAILPVERVRWGPEKDQPFTEAALQRGKPVVFEGTEYAADCPAAKWTLESVATTLSSPVLENVKRYPALPGAPLFATGMRMARVPEIMATYTPHFSRHNVTFTTFFKHLGEGPSEIRNAPAAGVPVDDSTPQGWLSDGNPVLSYAGRLREWRALEADLPLDGLAPEPPGDDPIEVKPYVWLGQKGVRTPLHYDYYANFYLQILGRKKFLLLPPSHHTGLQLYPSTHPAHRSSQLNLTDVLEIDRASVADPAYEVELGPGDILHLPAQWFHEVTTLTPAALAANVWAEDVPWFQGLQALNVNLPFTADYMASQPDTDSNVADFWAQDSEVAQYKVQLIRAYIILVIQQTNVVGAGADEKAVASWLQNTLLNPRYQPPTFSDLALTAVPQTRRFCQDLALVAKLGNVEGGMAVHFLLEGVREVMSVFDGVKDTLGHARFEMLLHNWIESVIDNAFGTKLQYPFLYDLCHC